VELRSPSPGMMGGVATKVKIIPSTVAKAMFQVIDQEGVVRLEKREGFFKGEEPSSTPNAEAVARDNLLKNMPQAFKEMPRTATFPLNRFRLPSRPKGGIKGLPALPPDGESGRPMDPPDTPQ